MIIEREKSYKFIHKRDRKSFIHPKWPKNSGNWECSISWNKSLKERLNILKTQTVLLYQSNSKVRLVKICYLFLGVEGKNCPLLRTKSVVI